MAVSRRPVSVDDEEMILVGLITNEAYCRQVFPILKDDHLKNRYARTVLRWVREYWDEYEKPIDQSLTTVYQTESERLPDDEDRLIAELLANLSDRYAKEPVTNWEYWIERAKTYLRRRALEILLAVAKTHLDRREINKAEFAVYDFLAPGNQIDDWVFPFIDEDLQRGVADMISQDGIFRYDGAVGDVVGGVDRGWLMAFFGPPKRGKTYWMAETAVQGICQKLRVAFISLEMQKKSMTKRFIQNATSLPDRKGDITIPVWDCKSHQDDSCKLPERIDSILCPRDKAGNYIWDPESHYKPCTACKGHKDLEDNYRVASWFRIVDKQTSFAENIVERTAAFAAQYHGGNLALICHPRFSATVEDLENSIRRLESLYGFVPDMIVVDYADILREEGKDERERLDRIWKKMGGMAQRRNCIVVTASQTNRESFEATTLKQTHIAEDYRKAAHLDLAITLNQGEAEKESMLMRIGVMYNRHREASARQVFVLQNLSLGQPAMATFTVSNLRAETIVGLDDD